jgi:hypothetical protein
MALKLSRTPDEIKDPPLAQFLFGSPKITLP